MSFLGEDVAPSEQLELSQICEARIGGGWGSAWAGGRAGERARVLLGCKDSLHGVDRLVANVLVSLKQPRALLT